LERLYLSLGVFFKSEKLSGCWESIPANDTNIARKKLSGAIEDFPGGYK